MYSKVEQHFDSEVSFRFMYSVYLQVHHDFCDTAQDSDEVEYVPRIPEVVLQHRKQKNRNVFQKWHEISKSELIVRQVHTSTGYSDTGRVLDLEGNCFFFFNFYFLLSTAAQKPSSAHQESEGHDLQYALHGEEHGEGRIQMLQHRLIGWRSWVILQKWTTKVRK